MQGGSRETGDPGEMMVVASLVGRECLRNGTKLFHTELARNRDFLIPTENGKITTGTKPLKQNLPRFWWLGLRGRFLSRLRQEPQSSKGERILVRDPWPHLKFDGGVL